MSEKIPQQSDDDLSSLPAHMREAVLRQRAEAASAMERAEAAARARRAASSVRNCPERERELREEHARTWKAIEAHAAVIAAADPVDLYLRFVAGLLKKPYNERRFRAMYMLLHAEFNISIADPPNLSLWKREYEIFDHVKARIGRARGAEKARRSRRPKEERDRDLRDKIARMRRRGLSVKRITELLRSQEVKIGRDRVTSIVRGLPAG